MANAAPQYWLIILICSQLAVASCVLAVWWLGSRSTRPAKRPPSQPQTPPSETQLAQVAADQAELFSTLAKLTTTVKRLSSRAGMQDFREREREQEVSAPPVGASKADLLRHYGMSGKVGPSFAQAQLELERKH